MILDIWYDDKVEILWNPIKIKLSEKSWNKQWCVIGIDVNKCLQSICVDYSLLANTYMLYEICK